MGKQAIVLKNAGGRIVYRFHARDLHLVMGPAAATTGKSAIDPDLYDLARVEVLGGPQGNLYGAGSLGGTVKLVSPR